MMRQGALDDQDSLASFAAGEMQADGSYFLEAQAGLARATAPAPVATGLVSSASADAQALVSAATAGIPDGAVALSFENAFAVAATAMKTGPLSALDSQLSALLYSQTTAAVAMSAFTGSVQQFAGAFAQNGQYVLIDATAKDGNGTELLAQLQAIGLKGGSAYGAMASGYIPVANIAQLASTANLSGARESAYASSTGSVTTQADHAEQADTARTTYSVDGSGLRVGVLSDSFDRDGSTRDTMSTNIASNDLPTDTHVLQDLSSTGTDEGRAMAQLIHDLAPGASIDFATAYNGQAGFANNILALAAAGDRVIVDDVSYFGELTYQNGVIAQAVNQVAAQGVAYFSSAGNDGNEGYEGAWASGATQTYLGQNYTMMQFAPGQDYINVTTGSSQYFILQWDQPGASAGGGGATSDLDIFLTTADGTIVTGSIANNIGGDPVEVFYYSGTAGQALQIHVGLRDGSAAPGEIRLIAAGNGTSVNLEDPASNTNDGTIYGHHAAAGAIGVGAASFADTPVAGHNPPVSEYYSSGGTQKLLYDDEGNRLAAPVTSGVSFTAVDGGNTTFFSSDSSEDTDTLPNFYGTSAAAPDAAAVAALMIQANTLLTPTDIRGLLMDSAIAMADASTSGAGLIQADKAVGFATGLTIQSTDQTTLYGTHLNDTIIGSSGADTLYGYDGNDTITAGDGADTVYGGAGNDILYGNQGDDKIFGESGNDTIYGGQGDDQLNGGAGDDFIEGGLGNDLINGGTGFNTVGYTMATGAVSVDLGGGTATGAAGTDALYNIQNVIGSAYADTITGSDEANYLNGGAGSDSLSGGLSDDTLDGGGAVETMFASTVDEPNIVKSASTVISSMATALVLNTGAGGDFDLVANGEIESAQSLPHATIQATASGGVKEYYAITVQAGDHAVFDMDHVAFDSVIDLLDSSGNVIDENDDDYSDPGSTMYASRIAYTFDTAGTYYLRVMDYDHPTGPVAGATYTLNVSLSSAQVTYDGTYSSGYDTLDGGAGNDTVTYASALSGVTASLLLHDSVQDTGGGGLEDLVSIENLTGSNYNDTLIGDDGANVLTGGFGADTLTGNGGNDTLYGNQGDDILYGNQGNDTLYGGQDNDTLYGGQGDDVLHGNLGNDVLEGGVGNDMLYGDDGIDTAAYTAATTGVTVSLLLQGTAQDTVGAGSDTLFSIENLTGSSYADTLTGDNGDNMLTGGYGNDTLTGGYGNDTLYGNQDNDVLYGNQGNDTLYGGQGNDTLYGGQDNDLLNGGIGNDKLVGGLGNDVFRFDANFGQDVITDFSLVAGNTDTISFGAGTFANYGQLAQHMVQSGNDVVITLDAADTIVVQNVALAALTADHFVFG